MKSLKIIISLIYSILVSVRSGLYNLKILKTYKFDVPIISIGNLTIGGSCKTPMVVHIAKMLKGNQFKPCIISRGYKRKDNHMKLVVVNDDKPSIDEVGDEVYMISKSLPGTPIVIADKKVAAIDYAINNLDVNIIILDDGFQSLSVHRNIDIVMINALLKEKDYNIFPYGMAREKIDSLKRADLIIITKNNLSDNSDISFVTKHNKNTMGLDIVFSLIEDNNTVMQNDLQTLKLIPVCGIADPDSFIRGINSLGINTVGKKIFSDHHHYSENDIENLKNDIENNSCDGVVTTYKDLYKIKKIHSDIKIYIIKMDLKMNEDKLIKIIHTNLGRCN